MSPTIRLRILIQISKSRVAVRKNHLECAVVLEGRQVYVIVSVEHNPAPGIGITHGESVSGKKAVCDHYVLRTAGKAVGCRNGIRK
jgi:hypothetical protein